MKAVVLKKFGHPEEVLELDDIPRPDVGHHDVLVKVVASSVNDWDWNYVRGRPYVLRLGFGLTMPRTSILGAEVAGIVEQTGPGVTRFSPGDRVFGDVSEAGFGGFAEYASVHEDALARMPDTMGFEQASAIPHAATLARQGLVDLGKIKNGDRVLINGAGGGVGTIGLQIAKRLGCEVTGVDSSIKLDSMKEMGFDQVVDYRIEDFTRNGERYNLILDTKTNRSPFAYLRSLKSGGRYITVGGRLPRLLQVLLLGPFIRVTTGKQMRLVPLDTNKDLDDIGGLFEAGHLDVRIDGPYPLDDVPNAVRHFGEAKHIGKVVIRIAN